MAKLTLSSILSAFNSVVTLNANNDLIEAAIENTLSRDGTSPNAMGDDLDMNSNRILNLPAATGDTEPVRLGQITQLIVDAAITYEGSWTTATAYEINDAVANDGSLYLATADHTSDASTEPGTGGSWMTVWDLVASKGDTGDTGAAGADGVFDGSEATVTPASGDKIALLDVSDSDNPKYADFDDFGGGGGGNRTSTFVYRNTALTGLTNGINTISYDAEDHDDLGIYDSGTSTSEFTIPAELDGEKIKFSAACRVAGNLGTSNAFILTIERDTGGGYTGAFPGNTVVDLVPGRSNAGMSFETAYITVSSGDMFRFVVNTDDTSWTANSNFTWFAAEIL